MPNDFAYLFDINIPEDNKHVMHCPPLLVLYVRTVLCKT